MARFRQAAVKSPKTVNLAGGEAYQLSPKEELVTILLTSLVQDQYYRSAGDTLKRFVDLIDQCGPEFVAKASIFARNEYGMRSISHVAAAEVVKRVKGAEWTKRYIGKVVYRVDDITEIFGYYIKKYGKPIPNALKKGISLALAKFNEHLIAKYKTGLVDIVNMTHPKPSEKNSTALEKLIKGTLVSTDTWESELSKAGQTTNVEEKAKNKEEAWEKLVETGKIGYFALLRNIRNITSQAPNVVDKALELLVDRDRIKKSLVFPFRFLTAMQAAGHDRKVNSALSKALEISLDNVPKFTGKTLIAIDQSGSMTCMAKGDLGFSCAKVASVFGAVLFKSNDADVIVFETSAKYMTKLNPEDSVMSIAGSLEKAGGGTNFHSIFAKANKKYDRIIILSDMQGWVGYDAPTSTFNEYCKKYNCRPFIYSIDLAGHGTSQFPDSYIFLVSGFSEKIFDLMKVLETDKQALIKQIEAIEL